MAQTSSSAMHERTLTRTSGRAGETCSCGEEECRGNKRVRRLYARAWVLAVIWGGMLLVLLGASLLFSLVREVDWRVCAALGVIVLLALVILLVGAFGSQASASCHQGAPREQSKDTSARSREG